MISAIRQHWPEYLMEAIGLGIFMVVACAGTALLWHEQSPLAPTLHGQPWLQRMLMGIAMGLTAIGIIYSPMGKRSGAHINPAVTVTFFRLGKIAPWDAFFYVLAQFTGAITGVWLTWGLLGNWISSESVNYAVTVPGKAGVAVAFIAEAVISFGMMTLVLWSSNKAKLSTFTGTFAGLLIVFYITLEAPLSGMSMNPARTIGSAASASVFTSAWLYFVAPLTGMLLAGEVFLWLRGSDAIHCAKLYHTHDVRCIFRCGYQMGRQQSSTE